MNTRNKNTKFLIAFLTIGILLIQAGIAAADQIVVLRVVDQHGQEILGSSVWVLSQNVGTGSSISLPEGTHVFTVTPAV
ncbi:MAG: hypothetical protein ACYTDV_10845, partial [Planctomycetota bacterium]